MPHDPELVAEVRAWLSKARQDIAAAVYELQAAPPFANEIVLHARQAAAKALKAFLARHLTPFSKTHGLSLLGEAISQFDPGLEPILRPAARLTKYAWIFRDPGDPGEAAAADVTAALHLAREVMHAIRQRSPADAGL